MNPPNSSTKAAAFDADPMNSVTYFKSPIDTILESIEDDLYDHISLHDLLHAYANFSSRIRSQIAIVAPSDEAWPALSPLKLHSTQVLRALRRDIRRALVEPLSMDTLELTEDEVKHARDMASLSHHALCLLSDIFRFSALHALFTPKDLQDLLDDLLTIVNASTLPTPNVGKTVAMAAWILQTQTLPISVLQPKKAEIISALKRNIEGLPGRHGKSEKLFDTLKTIHNLLKNHGPHFLPSFSELVPFALAHLLSSSVGVRLQAAHALNGFVLAKIQSPTSQSHMNMSSHIRTFLDIQTSRYKSRPSEIWFPTVIQSALGAEASEHPGDGPFWALNVLASLVILSDHSLFSHPHSLKFLLPSLAQTLLHKRRAVRSLHPQLWKCFVWAFLRMSHDSRELQDVGMNFVNPSMEMEERAFLVVKQELHGGIGVALTASLLKQDLRILNPISKALVVIDDMVSSSNKSIHREGASLLAQLLHAIGTPRTTNNDQWDYTEILPGPLFDGTLLHANLGQVSGAVRSMGQFEIDKVRHLSEPEIVQHWDVLASIWIKCVEKSLQASHFDLSSDLLHIWQSLLLVHAQLTQEHCHLTTTPAIAKQITSIVNAFFVQTTFPIADNQIEEQFRQLTLVQQLWTIMKSVFSTAWLSAPAETILAAILERDFYLLDAKVNGIWGVMCSDLVMAGNPAFLGLIFVQNEHRKEIEVKRQLWSVLAKGWQSFKERFTWRDALTFLLIPVDAWKMSGHEVDLWETMLSCAVSGARDVSVGPTAVIDEFVQRLDEDKFRTLSKIPRLTLALFSHVILTGRDSLPMQIFSLIDIALLDLYPPRPELFSTCFRFLHLTRDLITATPSVLVVPVLVALRNSLCSWIADESEVLLEEEYNTVVMPLYCDSLSVLQHHALSLETLYSIAPFLRSAFVRMPPPALGPLAFQAFWKATYYGVEKFQTNYPEDVKTCLKAVGDVLDSNFSANLSTDMESQSPSTSWIPDSQGPPGPPGGYRGCHPDPSRHPPYSNVMSNARGPSSLLQQHSVQQSLQSAVRVTPAWKHSLSPEPFAPQLVAQHQLQDHLSRLGGSSDVSLDMPARTSLQDSLERINEDDGLRFIKRRKANPKSYIFRKFGADVSTNTSGIDSPARDEKRKTRLGTVSAEAQRRETMAIEASTHSESESESESTTRVLHVRPLSPKLAQRKRILFDGVEVLTYRAFLTRQHRQGFSLGSRRLMSTKSGESTPNRRMRCEPDHDDSGFSVIPDVQEPSLTRGVTDHLFRGAKPTIAHSEQSSARNVGKSPGRSQTAPTPSRPIMPLPLRRSRTTSARLGALQQAYAEVTDAASQIPVEDLVQATKLVHQIGEVLTEQMNRKLVGARRD